MARSTVSPVATSGPPDDSGPERSLALHILRSLRPAQWSKNLLVFAGLLFGAADRRSGLHLVDAVAVLAAISAFAVFCVMSGVVYLINDLADRESDRQHPLKAQRPIASGALPVPIAAWSALTLGAGGLAAAYAIGPAFAAVAVAYLVLQILYSLQLKHIVIIDVLTLAVGFVLRAVGGAVAVHVEISQWLLVCTILLALFIALAKRRHELVLLAGDAATHRPILGEYSAYLLDQMIGVVTASTLISYVFYSISPETQAKFGTAWLGLTIPFPLYGIFRYLYLVHQREGGGSPADLLLTDRPLLACVALWALTVAVIIYRPV
jgi:4-hydroxybenzoate polyprenyltransferase